MTAMAGSASGRTTRRNVWFWVGPVDRRRLLEVLGDRVEIALEVPDRERQRSGDDRQGHPEQRLPEVERAEDRQVDLDPVQEDEQRRDRRHRRQHEHAQDRDHEELAAPELEARERVRSRHPDEHRDDRRQGGELEAVDGQVQERHRIELGRVLDDPRERVERRAGREQAIRPGQVPRIDGQPDDVQDREQDRRGHEKAQHLEHELAPEGHLPEAGTRALPGLAHPSGRGAGHRGTSADLVERTGRDRFDRAVSLHSWPSPSPPGSSRASGPAG